jgi:DNA-binding CsgD family transcriptional regulator
MDVEDFSAIVADIYDAALDPPLWRKVLKNVCAFTRGGPSASLFWQDAAKKTGSSYFVWGGEARFGQLYWEKYIALNPFTPAAGSFPVEQLYSAADVLPPPEFIETEFYKEWMSPQGWGDVLSVNLDKTATGRAVFSIARHARDGLVDEEMRQRVRLLVPHVRRAVMIGKLIDLNRHQAAALADTLDGLHAGAFLVDAEGRLVHANTSANDMLNDGNVLHANGRLVAFDAKGDQELHDIFAAARDGDATLGGKGVAVQLTARNGDRFITNVLPLTSGARRQAGIPYSAVAAVFVQRAGNDTPPSLDALAERYQLTPSELRVLIAIIDIGGVPEVAATLHLSQATVRTHLRHVFEKTGVRRQADLVKLMASQSSPKMTRLDDDAPQPSARRMTAAE